MVFTEADHSAMTRERVLDLTRDEKLEYFHSVTVQHPRMELALEDILLLSAPNTGTDIILLVGPTGVGKSATVEIVRRKFVETHCTKIQADPELHPDRLH